MPEAPQDRSTTTTRRSPDVVGSRPPQLDRGRALRRGLALLVVVVVVGVVLVLRGGDDGPVFAGPAADDPVTVLCRSTSEQQSAACATAYFACRESRAKIVRDATLPRTARPRRIATAYVASDWSEWDPPVRDAAQRGCRKGLSTDPG